MKTIRRLDNTTVKTEQVDKFVIEQMEAAGVVGLALSVINDDSAYTKCFGYGNAEKSDLLHEDSIMSGASFSKLLFASIVMQLVDMNIIDLDTPLYKYLSNPVPYYDIYPVNKLNKEWQLLTARHCLSHTTGFPNSRTFTEGQKLRFYFTPGERYAYSGEGIFLLQQVVEHITGKGLEKLAKELIFDKLEMSNTSYISQQRFENHLAFGHDVVGGTNEYRVRELASAGGSLLTTINDYSKFIQYLIKQHNRHNSIYEEMFQKQISINSRHQFPTLNNETTDRDEHLDLSYGLGAGLLKTPVSHAFFKEGHDSGYQNYTIAFPEKKIGIVIMSNSDNAEMIFKYLLEYIIGDIYTPWEWEQYIPHDKRKPTSVGVYLYDIIKMRSIDKALEFYKKLSNHPAKKMFILNENELNNLGYQMLKEGEPKNAIKLFKLNVDEYPESANVYDSLAEAYLINGDLINAENNYSKAQSIQTDDLLDNKVMAIRKEIATIEQFLHSFKEDTEDFTATKYFSADAILSFPDMFPIFGVEAIEEFFKVFYQKGDVEIIDYCIESIDKNDLFYSVSGKCEYTEYDKDENIPFKVRIQAGESLKIKEFIFGDNMSKIPEMPKPSGSYHVGRDLLDFNGIESGNSREQSCEVWYPAIVTDHELTTYNTEDVASKAAEFLSWPKFLNSYTAHMKTNSYKAPSMAEGPFPVIIYNHGYSGYSSVYQIAFEELASHGYIVISLNHINESAVVLRDNNTEMQNPKGLFYQDHKNELNGKRINELQDIILNSDEAGELKKAYDELLQLTPLHNETIRLWKEDCLSVIRLINIMKSRNLGITSNFDMSRIGIMGHSVGGAVAGETLLASKDIKAGINLDGFQLGTLHMNILDKPFMFISSNSHGNRYLRYSSFISEKNKDVTALSLKGFRHDSFTDDNFLRNNKIEEMQIQLQLIKAFFDKHLKNRDIEWPKHKRIDYLRR